VNEWSGICGIGVYGEEWIQGDMESKVPILQATYSDSQRAEDYEGWLCGCGVVCRGEVQALLQPVSTRIYSDVLLFGREVR